MIPSALLFSLLAASAPVRVTPPSDDTPGFSTQPSGFSVAGPYVFFTASTPASGSELWVLDTLDGGIRQLTDMAPGPSAAQLSFLGTFGTRAVLSASDGIHGRELWLSDGTPGGTQRRTDIAPGPVSGLTTSGVFAALDAGLFFSGRSPELGTELFRWPDSQGRASPVTEALSPGAPSTTLHAALALGPMLYFAATLADAGTQWTQSDPLGQLTRLPVIPRSSTSASYRGSLVLDGRILYADGDRNLYRLAPPGFVPEVLASISPRSFLAQTLLALPGTGQAVFLTTGPDTIWRADGSDGGVSSFASPVQLQAVSPVASGGAYYFRGLSTTSSGDEVWVTDGTSAGTRLLADIFPGTASSDPGPLRALPPDRVLFSATDLNGRQLYVGTPDAGAFPLTTFTSSAAVQHYVAANGAIYFAATTAAGDVELWSSDGTPSGAKLLADLSPGKRGRLDVSAPFTPRAVRGAVGITLFDDPVTGVEPALLFPDAGAQIIDLDIGSSGSAVGVFGGGAFHAGPDGAWFVARTASTGTELFFSDGTASGTRLAVDFTPGPADTVLQAPASIHGRLYCAVLGPQGVEPYRATADAGLVLLADVRPGGNSSPDELTGLPDGSVLFGALTDADGEQLFWSNGVSGATRISDLDGGVDSVVISLRSAGPRVFFTATTPSLGTELYVTDGTAAGTRLVSDLYPGPFGSAPQELTAVGDRLYFTAQRSPTVRALLGSDGTLVSSIVTPADATVTDLAALGRVLYFVVSEPQSAELWRVTPPSTVAERVTAFSHVEGYARVANLFPVPDVLYFSANTADAGRGLYRTTDGGDVRRVDPAVSYSAAPVPYLYVPLNDHDGWLYYSAISKEGSRELYRVPTDDSPPEVTHTVAGTLGVDGWYTSDVTVTFDVREPQSGDSLQACAPVTLSLDTPGQLVRCVAQSRGGSTTDEVTIKRDTTPPFLQCPERLSLSRGATPSYDEVSAPDVSPVSLSFDPPAERRLFESTEATVTATDALGHASNCQIALEVEGSARSHYELGCSTAPGAAPLLVLLALLLWRRRRTAATLVLGLLVATPSWANEAPRKTALFTQFKAGVGVKPEYAESLTDYVQSELIKLNAYDVTGASEIRALMSAERQQQLLGCSEDEAESCLAELGGALNASRVFSGDVSYLGDSITVNVYLVEQASAKVLGRVGVRRDRDDQEGVLDELRVAIRELVEKDPAATIKVSAVSALMAGVRADADVGNGGAAPSITAELASRWVGVALTAVLKREPAGRLEGRFYPIATTRLRPYLALGGTVMATGLGLRGAVGTTIQLGSVQLFVDGAYEHFVASPPGYAGSALLIGGGVGWGF